MNGDGEQLADEVLGALASAPPETGLIAAEAVRKRLAAVTAQHARKIVERGTWSDVGRMLGIPRQTAFKRFRERPDDPPE